MGLVSIQFDNVHDLYYTYYVHVSVRSHVRREVIAMLSKGDTVHTSLFSSHMLLVRGTFSALFVILAINLFDDTFAILGAVFTAYVFFDGSYTLLHLKDTMTRSLQHRLLRTKAIVGFAAGLSVVIVTLLSAPLAAVLTVAAWIALVGVLEGIWVIKNVRNREAILLTGAANYLALSVALQVIFAIARENNASIYHWVIIGLASAFTSTMWIMSWMIRKRVLHVHRRAVPVFAFVQAESN